MTIKFCKICNNMYYMKSMEERPNVKLLTKIGDTDTF